MFVKILRHFIRTFLLLSPIFFTFQLTFGEQISVKFSSELKMIELDKHLFPRFKFKTQIILKAVEEVNGYDALIGIIDNGKPIFSDLNGVLYRLEVITSDKEKRMKIEKFLKWLTSPPGIAVIEDFSINDSPVFKGIIYQEEKKVVTTFEGNLSSGLSLSQKHCKRCHVVDENAFAGIDSSPSFHALRSMKNWEEKFQAFWTVNPHLSLISITDVYEAGSSSAPVTVAPIELNLSEVDDILAYVASIKPKELGGAITSW